MIFVHIEMLYNGNCLAALSARIEARERHLVKRRVTDGDGF